MTNVTQFFRETLKDSQLLKKIPTPRYFLSLSLPLFLTHLWTTNGLNVLLGPEYFDHCNSKWFGEIWRSQNCAVKGLSWAVTPYWIILDGLTLKMMAPWPFEKSVTVQQWAQRNIHEYSISLASGFVNNTVQCNRHMIFVQKTGTQIVSACQPIKR